MTTERKLSRIEFEWAMMRFSLQEGAPFNEWDVAYQWDAYNSGVGFARIIDWFNANSEG